MDLMQLARTPVGEWPPNGGNVLHAVLDDRQAGESDRLLAAELAGEVAIIDDDLEKKARKREAKKRQR